MKSEVGLSYAFISFKEVKHVGWVLMKILAFQKREQGNIKECGFFSLSLFERTSEIF